MSTNGRLFAILATILLLPPALHGQDSAAARKDSSGVLLPELTVTATRLLQPMRTVPLAVTAIDRAQLQDRRGFGLDEAMLAVPGVLAQSRAGGSDIRLVIRGFGARGAGDRSNAGTARGIRVLLDGIPETEPDGRTSFDLVDLAAVDGLEVVRSNVSSAWGNAAGGVVNLSTRFPYDHLGIHAQAEFGSFGLERYITRAGGPIGASTLSATFVQTYFDGWRRHSSARRSLLTLGYSGQLAARTRLNLSAVGAHNQWDIPGPLTRAQVDADPGQANATYLARRERRDNLLGRIGAQLSQGVGRAGELSAMAFVTPKHLIRSERGTYREFDRVHAGGNLVYRQPLALGGVPATLAVGGDVAHQDGPARFWSLGAGGGKGDTLRTDKREGSLNAGAFAEVELAVAASWRVLAGARFDDITYDYRDILLPQLNDRRSYTQLTPKLGVSWLPSAAGNVYVNVGGGIEAPAGNETDPAGTFGQDTITAINPLLEPMRSLTVEAGTRWQVRFGRTSRDALSVDLAAYQTGVRNELVPYRGGRFYFNAGRVRRRGLELGAAATTDAGLLFRGALTWSSNRYTEYLVDSVHYGRPGAVANFAGNEAVGVPGVFYGAELSWAGRPLPMVRLGVSVQGSSSYLADDANTITVPGYGILNAMLAIAEPIALGAGMHVRGFLAVNNLLDRRYVASAFLNPDVVNGTPVAFEPGLPRNVVVSLSVSR